MADELHEEGFVASDVDAEDLLDYLAPFVEPAAVPEFQFTRDWMREQFVRVRDPNASGGVAMKLNLPPELSAHPPGLAGRTRRAVPAQRQGGIRHSARGVPTRLCRTPLSSGPVRRAVGNRRPRT